MQGVRGTRRSAASIVIPPVPELRQRTSPTDRVVEKRLTGLTVAIRRRLWHPSPRRPRCPCTFNSSPRGWAVIFPHAHGEKTSVSLRKTSRTAAFCSTLSPQITSGSWGPFLARSRYVQICYRRGKLRESIRHRRLRDEREQDGRAGLRTCSGLPNHIQGMWECEIHPRHGI